MSAVRRTASEKRADTRARTMQKRKETEAMRRQQCEKMRLKKLQLRSERLKAEAAAADASEVEDVKPSNLTSAQTNIKQSSSSSEPAEQSGKSYHQRKTKKGGKVKPQPD